MFLGNPLCSHSLSPGLQAQRCVEELCCGLSHRGKKERCQYWECVTRARPGACRSRTKVNRNVAVQQRGERRNELLQAALSGRLRHGWSTSRHLENLGTAGIVRKWRWARGQREKTRTGEAQGRLECEIQGSSTTEGQSAFWSNMSREKDPGLKRCSTWVVG